MTRRLIAPLSNPSSPQSAKVYRDAKIEEFRSVFFVNGVKQHDSDGLSDSKAEAIRDAQHTLRTADEMQNLIDAQKAGKSPLLC